MDLDTWVLKGAARPPPRSGLSQPVWVVISKAALAGGRAQLQHQVCSGISFWSACVFRIFVFANISFGSPVRAEARWGRWIFIIHQFYMNKYNYIGVCVRVYIYTHLLNV